MTKPQIVFFGTGPVSLQTLEGIYNDFDIEAIITKPDRLLHGQTQPHPVKEWGHKHDIQIFQVADKAELTALLKKHQFSSQLGIVVDFGIIIAPEAIESFKYGIINSHFSLLPEWRGADPISFALLSGQPETGVSLMLISPKLDAGPIIAQQKLAIEPEATNPILTAQLVELSNQMLRQNVPQHLAGRTSPQPQDESKATFSRKLTKADGLIDWHKPAEQIEREIRTFINWPTSYTKLEGRDVIITSAHVVPTNHPGSRPGEAEFVKDVGIIMIECGKGTLCIDRLKPAGKKEMTAAEFLRGLS